MTIKTWNIGDILTSSDMNTYVRDWGNNTVFVGEVNGTQSLAPQSGASVVWQTEIFDGDGVHSTSTNPDQITPNIPGYYFLNGFVDFAAHSTQLVRDVFVLQNDQAFVFYAWSRSDFFDVSNPVTLGFSSIPCYCNGTTDFMNVRANSDSLNSVTIQGGLVGLYRLRG